MAEQLADKAVERRIAGRRANYEAEVRRVVDTTFDLIQRTGSLDPSMREILAAAGVSTQAFYRYFSSKDELMLVLLDEGRRRLVATLANRMSGGGSPGGRVQAWIEGVMAQAVNPDAAARTRPWVLSEQRLTELFPTEQQASVDRLVELLLEPIGELMGDPGDPEPRDRELVATFVYRLTFSTLRSHLVARTRPVPEETAALVAFCVGAARHETEGLEP